MNSFSGEDAARLLELLSQELEIFGRIHELTEGQAELIEADDVDAFNESLDRRQECIEKINGLHQEADVLMQSYMSSLNNDASTGAGVIDAQAGRLREMIAGCAALNEKNMAAAKEKAGSYTKRIGELSLNRKSLGSYMNNTLNNSEIFDKMT